MERIKLGFDDFIKLPLHDAAISSILLDLDSSKVEIKFDFGSSYKLTFHQVHGLAMDELVLKKLWEITTSSGKLEVVSDSEYNVKFHFLHEGELHHLVGMSFNFGEYYIDSEAWGNLMIRP